MAVFYLAAIIIVIVGLKYISPILIYLILSIFFTILIFPIFRFFNKKALPTLIAYILTMSGFILIFISIFYILSNSTTEFMSNLPLYKSKLILLLDNLNQNLEKYNYTIDINLIKNLNFVAILKSFLSQASSLFSGFLIVIIGVSFLLFESKNFSKKILSLNLKSINLNSFSKSVQKYFIIKSFTSLLTGLFVGIALYLYNMPYVFLFGFLAFILNFIPVIGSIIAAIPALLIALITYNLESTIILAIIYLIINISISNILEPKIMGDGLNLSPAVIFFSLIFWGWVFGIVGTFFAVVLTMTLKLALESSNKTKNIAYFLSK